MPRGSNGKRIVAHAEVDDDHEANFFKDNNTLVHLFPCDDYRSVLQEWVHVYVCYKDSGCKKERLVYKKGNTDYEKGYK